MTAADDPDQQKSPEQIRDSATQIRDAAKTMERKLARDEATHGEVKELADECADLYDDLRRLYDKLEHDHVKGPYPGTVRKTSEAVVQWGDLLRDLAKSMKRLENRQLSVRDRADEEDVCTERRTKARQHVEACVRQLDHFLDVKGVPLREDRPYRPEVRMRIVDVHEAS
ncbi:hypothetical protein ACQEVF_56500 [Nonomuraea polychroma]|uniref:hypothetical protein n=1 Tax=Nonomuraea polychroma TaxID=46176 RepID=UPI003D9279BC